MTYSPKLNILVSTAHELFQGKLITDTNICKDWGKCVIEFQQSNERQVILFISNPSFLLFQTLL